MMKTVTSLALLLLVGSAHSFAPVAHSSRAASSTAVYGYIPSGFTKESYAKFKADEAKRKAKANNLGGMGPKGFKSRSFQSFQEALERGEAEHLLPVMNAKSRVKKGELKVTDIPYMQRGGSWDDSDVKGARKKKWLSSDKEYATGGFKKEQSVSIFGKGEGLDWAGSRSRVGPSETVPGAAPKFGRNYEAPNVNDWKKKDGDKPKKFFGLF